MSEILLFKFGKGIYERAKQTAAVWKEHVFSGSILGELEEVAHELIEVAKTALTGKSAGAVKDFLAEISVAAVIAVAQTDSEGNVVDVDDIKIQKKHLN